MSKQLELNDIPRKRVVMVTESTIAPEEELVVDEQRQADRDAWLEELSRQEGIPLTDWFPEALLPEHDGYYEVRHAIHSNCVVTKVWFSKLFGTWGALVNSWVKFEWRGLRAPHPEGYPYKVEGARRSRAKLLT